MLSNAPWWGSSFGQIPHHRGQIPTIAIGDYTKGLILQFTIEIVKCPTIGSNAPGWGKIFCQIPHYSPMYARGDVVGEYIDKGIKALQGVSYLCIRLNTSKCHVANFTPARSHKVIPYMG